jgi:uncharacterized protein YutE (UPF0331/DUF86 family)
VNALSEIRPLTYDEFISDHVFIAAAERDFQVAIQAALDIGSAILADQQAKIPERYSEIFPALGEIGVLPADLAQELVGMAKFRNVLVHFYVEVDTTYVYRYLQDDLEDFTSFARYVSDWLMAQGEEL